MKTVPPFCVLGGFLLPTLFSAIICNAVIVADIDDTGRLVVNFNLLLTLPAAFVGSVYHNFVNQVIQKFRSQFFGIGVFTQQLLFPV